MDARQARLKVLEDEILRLTTLAVQSPNQTDQDNQFRRIEDLQREARGLRRELGKVSEFSAVNVMCGGLPARVLSPLSRASRVWMLESYSGCPTPFSFTTASVDFATA